ncbi:MAG TPA: NAD-dependent epimerase/dehydratase family protein, partial [Armatimonadota bacterium]|nr:NAD-dependent epimerase/dehydratase family protein [Armatimonadota bacterium]
EGHEVRVLDNLATGDRRHLAHPAEVDFHQADIRDPEALFRAMRSVEVVFHQAALPSVPRSIADPESCHEVNVTGTFNVLLAARNAGVRRVVMASSSAVYGDTALLPTPETAPLNPLSPYAAAKLAGEHYCRLFFQLYGLETVALRYFNVFGPRQDPRSAYAAVIPLFVHAVTTGEQPVIFGDGRQTRDFTSVRSVVHANLLAASAPAAAGKVYNVGGGRSISLNELLAAIAGLAGREVSPQYLPPKPGDIRDSVADLTAIRRDLGYEPRVTAEEALAELVHRPTPAFA